MQTVKEFFSNCNFNILDFNHLIGNLLRIDSLIPVSIEEALANYGVKDRVGPTAQFIRGCLRFDPDERFSIKEVQLHEWVGSGWSCSD
jgi:serine/threonine-protein kinase SRPK3